MIQAIPIQQAKPDYELKMMRYKHPNKFTVGPILCCWHFHYQKRLFRGIKTTHSYSRNEVHKISAQWQNFLLKMKNNFAKMSQFWLALNGHRLWHGGRMRTS